MRGEIYLNTTGLNLLAVAVSPNAYRCLLGVKSLNWRDMVGSDNSAWAIAHVLERRVNGDR